MKQFRWQGIDDRGMRVRGKFLAENVDHARLLLNQKRITLLQIKRGINRQVSRKLKISFEDITNFSREMATLLTSGISLASALEVMNRCSAKVGMRTVTKSLQKQVESGQLLSQALKLQAGCFDEIFCNLVAAGEHSGQLDNILNDITSYREKATALRRKIKKALFYPIAVLLIALIVTAGLLVFVIPEFEHLFHGLGAQLPLFTRAVMYVADWFQQKGWLGILMVVAMCLVLKYSISKSPRLRTYFDRALLHLPFMGNSVKNAILARCFSTMATTLKAGVPLLEAMELTANVSGNCIYRRAFNDLVQQIKSGQTIHVSMQNVGVFPAHVIQMVTIGEEAGSLEKMLQKLSDSFEQQVDYTVSHLAQLLEPAIMVILCVLVGCLVIAMYLPIFLLGSVI